MSLVYKELETYFNEDPISPDKDRPVVELNDRRGRDKYYHPETFNDNYLNYIKAKVDNYDLETDPENNCQVMHAANCLYLDADFYFNFPNEFESYNTTSFELSKSYLKEWQKEINCDHYYFIFLPTTWPEQKGGFHVLIVTNKVFNRDSRNEIYNRIKNRFRNADCDKLKVQGGVYNPTKYEIMMDKGPLMSMSFLLPFAQKSKTSRKYEMFETSYTNQTYFIHGSPKVSYPQASTSSQIIEINTEAILPEPLDRNVQDLYVDVKKFTGDNYGWRALECAEFVESLKNLNHNHAFFVKLANNQYKLQLILTPIIERLVNLTFLEKGHLPINEEHFIDCVCCLLLPLINITVSAEEKTNRNSYDSLRAHVKDYYFKWLNFNNKYSAVAEFYADFLTWSSVERKRKYKGSPAAAKKKTPRPKKPAAEPKPKAKKKRTSAKIELAATASAATASDNELPVAISSLKVSSVPVDATQDATPEPPLSGMDKEIAFNDAEEEKVDKKQEEERHHTEEKLRILQDITKVVIHKWHEFIKLIMNGMTDELRPFTENGRSPDLTFEEMYTESLCDNPNASVEPTYYIRTLHKWVRQFIPVNVFEMQSFDDTVRAILSCFARHFITLIPEGIDNVIYCVYNIHQSRFLRAYPYNQWVVDRNKRVKDSHSIIERWLRFLYEHLIKPNLTMHALESSIFKFFDILRVIHIESRYDFIRPISNAGADSDRIFMNIASLLTNEKQIIPQKLDPATTNFLPVRNGTVEFTEHGHVFHEDNYKIWMNGCTNIIYEKNYYELLQTDERKRFYYDKAWDIVKGIYPQQEERDYMLTLFSTVLNGLVVKDLFVELFGFGSDGKSTICNLILGMLGSNGVGEDIQMMIDGKVEQFYNPCGLGCSMQTFALLSAAKDGHNEGGIINLPGKRFCSIAEPDSRTSNGKLNCSMIKELTGGTTMYARGIYKSSQAFNPNVLMILQTNKVFEYSEDDTDAMRRRMCVVPHRAKFYSEITKERLQNLTFSKMADMKVDEMIKKDPYLWQAFFYILLPYTTKISKKTVSNIPRPPAICEATEESFNDATGINGFFRMRVEKCPNQVISFHLLVDEIIKEHNRTKEDGGLLKSKKCYTIRKEAANKIFNKYTGFIYKLKRCYLKNENSEVSGPRDDVSPESINEAENIREFFNATALNNETNINYKIVYILDHKFKENEY
jgi:hypothetical protein